jgi:hypothetical protein
MSNHHSIFLAVSTLALGFVRRPESLFLTRSSAFATRLPCSACCLGAISR